MRVRVCAPSRDVQARYLAYREHVAERSLLQLGLAFFTRVEPVTPGSVGPTPGATQTFTQRSIACGVTPAHFAHAMTRTTPPCATDHHMPTYSVDMYDILVVREVRSGAWLAREGVNTSVQQPPHVLLLCTLLLLTSGCCRAISW